MPTTPRGIVSPNDSDEYDLVTDLAAMGVSIDTAIGAVPSPTRLVGSNGARLAYPAFEGLAWRTTDTRLNWLYTNGQWIRSEPGTAFAKAAGTVAQQSVAAGGASTVAVVFPAGRFTVPPIVNVSNWGTTRDTVVAVDNITAAGCNILLGSLSTVSRTFGAQWEATQMTATTAAG